MAPSKNREDLKIFLSYADHAASLQEDCWYDFFAKCAVNKFPPRVKFSERNLLFRKGARTLIVNVPVDFTVDQYTKVVAFFRDDVCVYIQTRSEGVAAAAAATETPKKVSLIDRITKLREVRNTQLVQLAEHIAERDGLTHEQHERLFALIAWKWLAGRINAKCLVVGLNEFGNEVLLDVSNLKWDPVREAYIVGSLPKVVAKRSTNATAFTQRDSMESSSTDF